MKEIHEVRKHKRVSPICIKKQERAKLKLTPIDRDYDIKRKSFIIGKKFILERRNLVKNLTFENDSVSFENFKFIHLGLGHLNDRIVVNLAIFNLQFVWGLLAVHNRS